MKKYLFIILFWFAQLNEINGQIPNLSNLVRIADKTILKLYTIDENGEFERQGSAVITTKNGIAITNYHVLAGSKKAVVIDYEGKQHNITKIIDYSENEDLIKFKFDTGAKEFSAVKLRVDEIFKGNDVFALGYPDAFEIEGGSTVTTGIISGIRTVNNVKYLQTSAPFTHGSSGGGLFDTNGNLCGITSGTFASEIKDRHANLNKAIPSKSINKLNNNLDITMFEFYEKISRSNIFSQAMAYYEDYDFLMASEYFKLQLQKFPDDAVSWMRYGNCLNQIGRWNINENIDILQQAIDCFDICISLDKTYYHAYGQAALVSIYLNRMNDAFNYAQQALKIKPTNSFTNYIMGRILSEKKEYDKAIRYFSYAIEYSDDYEKNYQIDQLYLERAIANGWEQHDQLAERDFLKAIELNNNNFDALFYYANFLSLRNRKSESCKYFNLLLYKNPRYIGGGNTIQEYVNYYCK